jgi:hypothetical protein
MEQFEKLDEVLRLLVGQYVWSVRSGVDTWITMEFGEPHRRIREPRQASEDASELVKRILARRLITMKGDLSLFIQDSQWSISTGDAVVNWNSDAALVGKMPVHHLDGQKVLSAVRRSDETVLEFDLGTTLRLGKTIFPNDVKSVLWSIQLWENSRISILDSGAVVIADWKRDEADANSDPNLPRNNSDLNGRLL